MPRIPTFSSNRLPPGTAGGVPMSPGAAAAVPQAIAGVGQQMERSALYTGRVFETIKKAERTVKANGIEIGVTNDFEDAALQFAEDANYEGYEEKAGKITSEISDRYYKMVANDPVLSEVVSAYLENKTRDFNRVIAKKKIQKTIEAGQGLFLESFNNSLDSASDNPIPENVAAEKNRITELANGYVDVGILTAKQAVTAIESFDDKVQAATELKATTAAKNLILEHPSGGSELLEGSEFWDRVPDEQKPALLKSADKTKKVHENEVESKRKEAIAEATKQEELQFSNLYGEGKFAEANAFLDASTLITKKIPLYKALESASKEADPFKKTDYNFFWDSLKKAQAGKITNPDAVIPIPNKLSREDANIIRATAKRAIDPVNKAANEMERKALSAVEEQAKEGSSFFGYSTEDKENAYNAWVALKLVLDEVKDPSKKIDMLNPKSPNYIVSKVMAPYIKDKNNMNNAQYFIDVLRGVDKKTSPPVTEETKELTNFHINPETKETIGWNGSKWVTVPNK